VTAVERLRRHLDRKRAAGLLLLWLVSTTPVLLPGEPSAPPEPAGLPLLWVRVAAVPLLGFAVVVARRMPLAAAVVPAALGLAATPEVVTGRLVLAQLLFAYLLGRRLESRRTALLFFAAMGAVGLLLLPLTPGATTLDGLSLASKVLLTFVFPWLVGQYEQQRAGLVHTGWELAERLEREQALVADRARLRERARIAEDMHDSLGHELSLIALRAAAIQVAVGLGPEQRQAAGELRRAAESATERLREVIGVLRQDGEPAPVLPAGDSVESLVKRAAASGMAVTLDDDVGPAGAGGAGPLPPMADRAIYRVVQEALTNATRHAPGAAVTVTLRREGDAALVRVVNQAPPSGPGGPGGSGGPGGAGGAAGYGLVGLDERVRLAGGTLDARPADGGFAITARLPLTAGAAATPPGDAGASRRQLALARRKAWRSMIDATWLPVAATAILVLLTVGYYRYAPDPGVLDKQVYGQLRIGERQASVAPLLPARPVGGGERGERPEHAPADPPGAGECRFYRATPHRLSPAYRLCFTGGRLSHKATVNIDD
jgi:signal transduction histidine kinase